MLTEQLLLQQQLNVLDDHSWVELVIQLIHNKLVLNYNLSESELNAHILHLISGILPLKSTIFLLPW